MSLGVAKGGPSAIVRVCVDLNVFVGRLLSRRLGRENTANQVIVEAVMEGRSSLGPIQLVVSHGMLSRMRAVLESLNFPSRDIEEYLEAIATWASIGPALTPPYLALGGTGVLPLRDEEDAHVVETALAGRADYLVTANLSDFEFRGVSVVVPNRVLRYEDRPSGHLVLLVHPHEMARRLREAPPGRFRKLSSPRR